MPVRGSVYIYILSLGTVGARGVYRVPNFFSVPVSGKLNSKRGDVVLVDAYFTITYFIFQSTVDSVLFQGLFRWGTCGP